MAVEVQVLKISPETRRISLGMKQLQPDPWTATSQRLSVGERVQGKVSRLTDFGAFIEIAPGVDGLIHISEMSWSKKIKRPSDVLKPGEMVEVVVLGVNAQEHRISLGLKQALGDPWEEAQRKYTPGAVVEGAVTSLTNFGCFVDLGNGIEGMIHISDITGEKRLNHPREAHCGRPDGARRSTGSGPRTAAHQAGHEATAADRGGRIYRRAQRR